MQIQVSKKGFYKLAKRIFKDIAEIKDGYPVIVPIANHHIHINGILCFLDDDVQHYLSFNSYGQMDIQREIKDGARQNHICFDLANLSSLDFLAKNPYGEKNPNTDDYYNDFYRFTLTGEL